MNRTEVYIQWRTTPDGIFDPDEGECDFHLYRHKEGP